MGLRKRRPARSPSGKRARAAYIIFIDGILLSMNPHKTIFLFVFLLALSCTGSPSGQTPTTQTDAYPQQPEEVIRHYQAHIDSNRFEQAKTYSTEGGKAWIDTLSKIISSSSDDLDSTLLHTSFLNIDCKIQQDTAFCNCLAVDQDGEYEVLYQLIRQDGKWKIEAPKEDELWIDEQLIQDMIQQFNQE